MVFDFRKDGVPHWKVDSLEKMRLVTHSPGTIIVTDGRFGSNYFKKVDTGTENGGTVFVLDNGDVYELQFSGAVNVKWFGVVGDGSDETAKVQAVLDTDYLNITFEAGKTVICSGVVSGVEGRTVVCTGATLKLKDSATLNYIISLAANNSTIVGGFFDGNKSNGNSSGSVYDSWGIGIRGADYCTVKNVEIKNAFGSGVGGYGQYNTVENSKISGSTRYGIYFDGAVSAVDDVIRGNKAINNSIDMTGSGTDGQAILFTGIYTPTTGQFDSEIRGNTIIGGTDAAIGSQGINIAVRGNHALIIGNTTRYGAMGFSEGGDNTVISNNIFMDLAGTVQVAIEVGGEGCTVTGNIVKGAKRAVDASATIMDNMVISGNRFETSGSGIRLQPPAGGHANDVVITGNSITCIQGIRLVRTCIGATITGNNIKGSGTSKAIFMEVMENSALHLHVANNTITNQQRMISFYSATDVLVTDISISNNYTYGVPGVNSFFTEGLCTIDANCRILGASGGFNDLLDAKKDIRTIVSSGLNDPNGSSFDYGPGSLFRSSNQNGGMWFKSSVSGINTGWQKLY